MTEVYQSVISLFFYVFTFLRGYGMITVTINVNAGISIRNREKKG